MTQEVKVEIAKTGFVTVFDYYDTSKQLTIEIEQRFDILYLANIPNLNM